MHGSKCTEQFSVPAGLVISLVLFSSRYPVLCSAGCFCDVLQNGLGSPHDFSGEAFV
jgi:hypothetical protein